MIGMPATPQGQEVALVARGDEIRLAYDGRRDDAIVIGIGGHHARPSTGDTRTASRCRSSTVAVQAAGRGEHARFVLCEIRPPRG